MREKCSSVRRLADFGGVSRNRDERADLLLLGVGTVLTLLVWLLLLGWSPSKYIPNHDALEATAPHVLEDIRVGGVWQNLLYRIQVLGGSPIHDVGGGWVIYDLGAWLGLSVTATVNFLVFFLQILTSFFLVRSVFDLRLLWRSDGPGRMRLRDYAVYSIPLFLLTGFAPFMAYKLSYGHFIFIIGSLPFVAAFSVFAAACAGRLTVTLLVASLISVYQCFCWGGQQPLVYSAVFGLPIFIGLACVRRPIDSPKGKTGLSAGIVTVLFVAIAGILLAMPQFAGIVSYAFSGEGGRSIGGPSVVYSFIKATSRDWLSSIPWWFEMIPSGRNESHHEVNYALGPLVLLLLSIPWKKAWPLFAGMMASAAMAVMFSMEVEPFTGMLLKICPLLNSFRVPERAIIPFMFILPVAALAGVLNLFRAGERRTPRPWGEILSAALFTCVPLIWLLPRLWMEISVWVLAAVVVSCRFIGWRWRTGGAAVLLLFAVAGVASFKERLLPYTDLEKIVETAGARRLALLEAEPALASPLVRAKLEYDYDRIGLNYSWLTGISSLDGYWFPGHRFSMLYQLLREEKYLPTETHFRADRSRPGFTVLRQLYNIGSVYHLDADGKTPIRSSAGKTAGEAWFAGTVIPVESWDSMVATLMKHGNRLHEAVKKNVWILSAEIHPTGVSAGILGPRNCGAARITGITAGPDGQKVGLDVVNPDDTCPLIISMNYSTFLKVKGRMGNREITVGSFPAYGPLLGVLVPPGVEHISVEAAPVIPWYAKTAALLGMLLAISVVLLVGVLPRRN